MRRIQRELPFQWEPMPAEYTPVGMTEPGATFIPPFDVISFSVAADNLGRAFILTGMATSRNAAGEPDEMAIDVISPDSTVPRRRFTFDGFASHLAVSPDGERIYLLDEHNGTIRTFTEPEPE